MSDVVKQQLVAWEKNLSSTIGKVRRAVHNKEVDSDEMQQTTLSAQKVGLSTLMSGDSYNMTKLERKIAEARVSTVNSMRNVFQKYIIRRTNKSIMWDEKTQVNPLPMCTTYDYTLQMNSKEKEVLDAIRARVVEEV